MNNTTQENQQDFDSLNSVIVNPYIYEGDPNFPYLDALNGYGRVTPIISPDKPIPDDLGALEYVGASNLELVLVSGLEGFDTLVDIQDIDTSLLNADSSFLFDKKRELPITWKHLSNYILPLGLGADGKNLIYGPGSEPEQYLRQVEVASSKGYSSFAEIDKFAKKEINGKIKEYLQQYPEATTIPEETFQIELPIDFTLQSSSSGATTADFEMWLAFGTTETMIVSWKVMNLEEVKTENGNNAWHSDSSKKGKEFSYDAEITYELIDYYRFHGYHAKDTNSLVDKIGAIVTREGYANPYYTRIFTIEEVENQKIILNTAPVANNDNVNTSINTPVTIPTVILLDNDTDVEEDNLTVTAVGNAINGNVTLNDNSIIFFPEPDFIGNASFEYTLSDGELTDTGTVSVDVILGATIQGEFYWDFQYESGLGSWFAPESVYEVDGFKISFESTPINTIAPVYDNYWTEAVAENVQDEGKVLLGYLKVTNEYVEDFWLGEKLFGEDERINGDELLSGEAKTPSGLLGYAGLKLDLPFYVESFHQYRLGIGVDKDGPERITFGNNGSPQRMKTSKGDVPLYFQIIGPDRQEHWVDDGTEVEIPVYGRIFALNDPRDKYNFYSDYTSDRIDPEGKRILFPDESISINLDSTFQFNGESETGRIVNKEPIEDRIINGETFTSPGTSLVYENYSKKLDIPVIPLGGGGIASNDGLLERYFPYPGENAFGVTSIGTLAYSNTDDGYRESLTSGSGDRGTSSDNEIRINVEGIKASINIRHLVSIGVRSDADPDPDIYVALPETITVPNPLGILQFKTDDGTRVPIYARFMGARLSNEDWYDTYTKDSYHRIDVADGDSANFTYYLHIFASPEIYEIIDDAPVVNQTIEPVTVDKDAENTTIDLSEVFADADNDDNAIAKSVLANTNENLVTATIVDNELILDYQENQSGIAEITVRGTSNGKSVDTSFIVTVSDETETTFDIDGDGQYLASVDGLLFYGYLNIRGLPSFLRDNLTQQLADNLINPDSGATRTSGADIANYLEDAIAKDELVDIDGDGEITASIDGLLGYGYLNIRSLPPFLRDNLTQQLADNLIPEGSNAIRTTGTDIANFIESYIA